MPGRGSEDPSVSAEDRAAAVPPAGLAIDQPTTTAALGARRRFDGILAGVAIVSLVLAVLAALGGLLVVVVPALVAPFAATVALVGVVRRARVRRIAGAHPWRACAGRYAKVPGHGDERGDTELLVLEADVTHPTLVCTLTFLAQWGERPPRGSGMFWVAGVAPDRLLVSRPDRQDLALAAPRPHMRPEDVEGRS